MDRLWRRIGGFLSGRATLVLVAVAVLTVGLGVGATRLDFATGQDSYLDRGTATAKANRDYQKLFGGEAMLVLFTAGQGKTVADLFTPANRAQMQKIGDQLRTAKGDNGVVFSVVDPLSLLTWTSDLVTKGVATDVLTRAAAKETDPAKADVRKADSQLTLARALGAGKQALDNPAWVSFLLHDNDGFTLNGTTPVAPSADKLAIRRSLRSFIPDEHHALFAVILKGNASLDDLAAGNKLVKNAFKGTTWENADVVITGTPTFLTAINDYLQGGMFTLGLIALAVMVFVLGLVFGVRWRFLPLAIVVIGVLWGFGAFGYTGVKLSLVTISGLPILIGLGMDFAIQIHNRAQEEVTTAEDRHPFEQTLAKLGPPLALATVLAAISFLVMLISRVPMIRDFGVLLTIGIVALVVVGVTVTVAVLALREKRSPSTKPLRHGPAERVVVWLGALPRAAALPLIAIAVVLPVVGLVLERDARIESDPINWANQSSQTIKDARRLEHETGFATTLGVFVQTSGYQANGVFTDQLGAFVHDFELNAVASEGKLLPAGSSIASVLSYLIDVPGATALPPTGLDMLQAYNVAPPDIQRLLVGDNGNAMQITFNVGPSSLENRAKLIDRLNVAIADPPSGRAALPERTTATPAGLARVGVALLRNLTTGRSALTYVTLLLVGALLMLRLRNAGLALLTLIPVLFAVGAAAALVAALNITLSPITTVGAPLVIALCAEFSILLTSRYAEERERGFPPREAMDHASSRTGRAFTASALATIGGFGVIMFSSLPLLRDFGAVVTLKVVVALLSALVVVPPVAVWADERGLLGLGVVEEGAEASRRPSRQPVWLPAGLGVVLAASGFALAANARGSEKVFKLVRTQPAAAAPATTAAPTTLPPTTTTTIPPTTTTTAATSAGGSTTTAGASTTAASVAPTTLPPGPPTKPATLVAGAVYDAFVAAGAPPGQARCTADALVNKTPEDQLIAKGIATRPPSAAAAALVAEAANACGVPADVQAKVATASG